MDDKGKGAAPFDIPTAGMNGLRQQAPTDGAPHRSAFANADDAAAPSAPARSLAQAHWHGSALHRVQNTVVDELRTLYQTYVYDPSGSEKTSHGHFSVAALAISIVALFNTAKNPYVIDKFKKCVKPIAAACAVVYLSGQLIIIPLSIVSMTVKVFTFGATDVGWLVRGMQSWVHEAVGLVAFFVMLLLRRVIKKPIFKCFIHTLRDINPKLAEDIETSPPLAKPGGDVSSAKKSKTRRVEQRINRMYAQVARIMLLSFVTYLWRQIPVLGLLCAPTMLFMQTRALFGPQQALALSSLALIPQAVRWVLLFVNLWRSSRVISAELLDDYMAHRIPYLERADWLTANEVPIFCYLLPQLLLMNLPIVGPLTFIPAAAAAAYLVDFLDTADSKGKTEADKLNAAMDTARAPIAQQ